MHKDKIVSKLLNCALRQYSRIFVEIKNIQFNKVNYNVWYPVKYYQAYKEAEKYDP